MRNTLTYYSIEDFLVRIDLGSSGMNPMSAFSYDRAADDLTITNGNRVTVARIHLDTGVVQIESSAYPSDTVMWKRYGEVHPVVVGGQVYLTLSDLVVVGDAVAWAAPDRLGGVLISNSWLP